MSLIAELKRRNVFKVATAYIAIAWLSIQAIDVLVQLMGLPEWIGRLLVLMLIIGFPVALVLAWAYEMTPEGIRKERDVDRSKSITQITGRKLDFVIIGVLVVALIMFTIDRFPLFSDGTNSLESTALMSEPNSDSDVNQRKTVAVIPFVDISPAKGQSWIGDTIATEMQTELSKRSDLQVLSRSSSFAIPDDMNSSQEIGQILGVDVLVEGTVRRIGDRIRVTVQLVSVADGYQLWSDVFESRLRDDFSAEIAVAEFFSNQVRTQLAAPFTNKVQLAEFSKESAPTFENLFTAPLSKNRAIQIDEPRQEGDANEL